MTKYTKLFEPGYMGKLKIKNRIVKAPMYTAYAAPDGSVTQRLMDYYREMTLGGTGLVMVEYSYTDNKSSQSQVCQLGVYDRSLIPGLSNLARIIKDNGAAAGLQLCHCGRRGRVGKRVVAPSRLPMVLWGDRLIPDELTTEEIWEIVESTGNAAMYVEQAGFDMVEVHAAHGYLITEFLSAMTNKRNDAYGGSLQDRMRFLLEIIENIRKKVSRDFPLSVRINGSDYLEGGIDIEEAKVLSKELVKAGVDILHVSSGSMVSKSSVFPMFRPTGFNVPFAKEIRKVVDATIMVGGAITTPELAEDILQKGHADFITFARPILADPWFAKKAEEGRAEDIVPCIRCNEGCLARGMALNRAVSCTVNFTAGLESEYRITKTDKPKKVAVIGGGPGGLEAARVAALRGNKVTLYEQQAKLGGYLLEASIPEFKSDLRRLTAYFNTQMKKLGVKVNLKTEATAATIKRGDFDAVIVATGSQPCLPDIPGLRKYPVVTAVDVLRGAKVDNKVIVAGGGMVGSEIALYLAQQGKQVLIIEELPSIALDVEQETKKALLEGLAENGVKSSCNSRLEEVTKDGVIIYKDRKKQQIKGDTVVIALGFESRNGLVSEFEKLNIPVYTIGDCVKPRRVYDAMHEGFAAGYRV